jgi:hypothetical protein
MFLDYFRLSSPDDPSSVVDFISRVVFIGTFALIVIILGSKFRWPLGAAAALIYGLLLLLYNQGYLRF